MLHTLTFHTEDESKRMEKTEADRGKIRRNA